MFTVLGMTGLRLQRAVAWNLVDGEAEPVVPATGPALAWQRVPPNEALAGPGEQRLDDVVTFGDELVAVGSSHRPDEPGGDVDGAVWRSPDGIEWERGTEASAGLGGPGDQRVLGVTAGGPGLVAVGSDGGSSSAAIWRSSDGAAWNRVTADEAVFGGTGDQVASAVSEAGDGTWWRLVPTPAAAMATPPCGDRPTAASPGRGCSSEVTWAGLAYKP